MESFAVYDRGRADTGARALAALHRVRLHFVDIPFPSSCSLARDTAGFKRGAGRERWGAEPAAGWGRGRVEDRAWGANYHTSEAACQIVMHRQQAGRGRALEGRKMVWGGRKATNLPRLFYAYETFFFNLA
jgi:hypothetical protein